MCYIPSVRHPQLAKRVGTWQNHAYNWKLAVDDPTRSRPTGATINTLDANLGIFKISMPPNLENVIMRVFPFCLTKLPYPSLSSTTYLLEECQLEEEHHFETIVSIVWAVNREDLPSWTRHKIFTFSPRNAEGPEIWHLCDTEYARYKLDGSHSYDADGDDSAENDGIIRALANVEAARITNSYRDRYSGHCTFAGFVDTQLAGTIKTIGYSFTPGSGLTTTIDARDIPPPPTYEQSLNQRHIDFLRRHITRADGAAQIGRQ
jgi:hypothetical protein